MILLQTSGNAAKKQSPPHAAHPQEETVHLIPAGLVLFCAWGGLASYTCCWGTIKLSSLSLWLSPTCEGGGFWGLGEVETGGKIYFLNSINLRTVSDQNLLSCLRTYYEDLKKIKEEATETLDTMMTGV